MEYEFVLKFKLDDADSADDDVVERLGAAGCDDATVGIGLPGRIALSFTREASSAKQAILSALEDVKRAIPSAELIEVSPDLAGLTDIAELVGVSRQQGATGRWCHRAQAWETRRRNSSSACACSAVIRPRARRCR